METIGVAKVHNAFNEARKNLDYLSDHVNVSTDMKQRIIAFMHELDAEHHEFTEWADRQAGTSGR